MLLYAASWAQQAADTENFFRTVQWGYTSCPSWQSSGSQVPSSESENRENTSKNIPEWEDDVHLHTDLAHIFTAPAHQLPSRIQIQLMQLSLGMPPIDPLPKWSHMQPASHDEILITPQNHAAMVLLKRLSYEGTTPVFARQFSCAILCQGKALPSIERYWNHLTCLN